MKKCLFIFFTVCLCSCNEAETAPEPVSTVDSNLADPGDTIPPELYIDSHRDTSFTIALDSAGEAILPEDTSYNNKSPY